MLLTIFILPKIAQGFPLGAFYHFHFSKKDPEDPELFSRNALKYGIFDAQMVKNLKSLIYLILDQCVKIYQIFQSKLEQHLEDFY